VSDGGNSHYHNGDNRDDSRDQRMNSLRLVQKRKHDASVSSVGHKQHSRTSSKRSKQRLTYAAQSPTDHPPKPISKVRARVYAEVQCSKDTSSKISSNSAGNNKNNCYVNAKGLQSTDKLVLNWGSASDDTEYEVQQILASRIFRGNLQYQVQWVGYDNDPEWYNASNLKNCPRKLHEFHEANPTVPGPPRRLSHWKLCCDEDRDADNFSDDDKPGKYLCVGDVGLSGEVEQRLELSRIAEC
jgi:hypothetical protein